MIFNFSGCSSSRLSLLNQQAEFQDKEINKTLTIIIDSLEKKDKEKLKSVLSQKSLEDAENLDDGIDYMMNFYEGSNPKFEDYATYSEGNYGGLGRTELVHVLYTITNDKHRYVIYLEDWIIQEAEPIRKGVYKMKLSYDVGIVEGNDYGKGYNRAGIYNPKWDEEKRTINEE